MRVATIDKVILGTAGLGGILGKVNSEESLATIIAALEFGVKAIDTAPAYGDAEYLVGYALQQWQGEKPQVSTKVGRKKGYAVDDGRYDYTADGMKRSVENSLKTLGVSMIDVLFLHDPDAIDPADIEQVLKQLDFFKQHGYAKKIGLGGNTPEWLKPYLKSDLFDVLMEFNRLNALNIDALETTIPFCAENDKAYYAASPLHIGLLGSKFTEFTTSPPNWLSSTSIEQAKKINLIAEKYEIPLQVLAYRFIFSLEGEFKVVMGTTDRAQLADTLKAIETGKLSPEIYNDILQTLKQ